MTEQNVSATTPSGEGEGVLGAAASATGKAFRITLNILSMPLVILPGKSRRHARRAVGEFAMAILVLPREFATSSERVVERLVGEGGGDVRWPKADEITERARTFANRMMRTAEEFSSGVVSASQKVGDAAEQTASKVDEWVQKKA